MASNPTIPPPPPGFEPVTIPPPPAGFVPIETAPVDAPPPAGSVPGMEKLGGVPPGPAPPPRLNGVVQIGLPDPWSPKMTLVSADMDAREPVLTPGQEKLAAAQNKLGSARAGMLPGGATVGETAMLAIPPAAEAAGQAAIASGSAAARQGFAALDAALSAYFTYESAKGAGEGVLEAKKAFDRGDYGEMARNLGGAGINAAFGYWAGKQAKNRFQEVADIAKLHNELRSKVASEANAKPEVKQIAAPQEVPPPPPGFEPVPPESPIEGGSLYKYTKRIPKATPAAEVQPPAVAPPQQLETQSSAPVEEAAVAPLAPLRVYHGTDAEPFTTVDPAKFGSATDEGLLGRGMYFSTDPAVGRSNKNTLPAKVTLQSPLVVEYPKWGANKTALVNQALGTEGLSGAALTEELRRRGHDGVVLDYAPVGYQHKEVAALDPASVKLETPSPTVAEPPAIRPEVQQLQQLIPEAAAKADAAVLRRAQPVQPPPDELDQRVPDETPVVPVNPPAAPEEARGTGQKQPWEMSYEELDAAERAAKEAEKGDSVAVFGPLRAKVYERAYRKAQSSMDPAGADAAQKVVEEMEAGLTEQQRNRLYGIGETGPTASELQDYRRELGSLDWSSPEALGWSLRWAVTNVGRNTDPVHMNHEQRVAFAAIRRAMQGAKEEGWDTEAVSRAALETAANRFKDPEDAEFMLKHFMDAARPKPKAAPARPELAPAPPKQIEAPKPQAVEANPPAVPAEARGTGQEQNTAAVAPEQKPTSVLDQPHNQVREDWQIPQKHYGMSRWHGKGNQEMEAPREVGRELDARIEQMKALDAAKSQRIQDLTGQNLLGLKRIAKAEGIETEPFTGTYAKSNLARVIDHKRQVRAALAEGKPVPPEVLADYPELTQKAEAKPPDGGAQPTTEVAPVKENPIKAVRKRAAKKPKADPTIVPWSGEKHPWALTRSEYVKRELGRPIDPTIQVNAGYIENPAGRRIDIYDSHALKYQNDAAKEQAKQLRQQIAERKKQIESGASDPMLEQMHRGHVQMAVAGGKPVPPEVLADYPDLKPAEAPLQARLEGPSFRVGMSQSQKVTESQAVPSRAGKEKYPILRVNAQAMDLLHSASGLDGGHDIPGVTFTVPQAEEVLRNINTELRKSRVRGQKEQVAKWEALRSAVEQNRAAAKGRPMVVVQHGPDVTPEEHARALSEELDHATQLESTGDIYAHHLGPEGTKAFLDSPAGAKAAAQIRKTYDVGDSQAVMEIGVRLMRPGRYKELGLTAQEAADLQEQYIQALIQRHGVERTIKISDKVSAAREKDKEVSYGHQAPLEARRGAGRERATENAPGTRSGSKGSGSGDGGLPPVREKPLQSRSEGPNFKKENSRLKQLGDVPKTVRERIKQEGPAGVEIMRKIDRADTVGTVFAGGRVADLSESGIEGLSRDERFAVVDALEGRATPGGKVGQVVDVVRRLLDSTAREAEKSGVKSKRQATIRPEDPIPAGAKLTDFQKKQREDGKRVFVTYSKPFQARQNYYPHVIPSTDALGKGRIREDVIDAMVRRGEVSTPATAEALVDLYRKFVDEGGRAVKLEEHLINTGRARDASEARALMARFRKKAIKRQGSMESSRVVDLPFYDPDPLRVLPNWLASASMRLAEVREFRQNNEEINKLIHRIEEANGNTTFVRSAVERGLRMIREGDTGDEQVARFLMTLNGFRLSLSFIQNSTQGVLNTFLHTHDAKLTAKALSRSFTKQGRRFAARSGASLEGMINEMVRSVGRDDSALGKALEAYLGVSFTPSEKFNRILAANAGALWAQKMLRRLKINPKDGLARQELSALGLKPDVLLGIGRVDGHAALVAGKAFSDMTQFRSRVWDMPNAASKSTLGRMIWQFRNYGYQQVRLGLRDTFSEMRKGRWGRGAMSLLILATIFPMAGEVVADIRSVITGRKRPTKFLDRYIEDVVVGSALGLVADTIQGGMARRGAETIGGPPVSVGGQALDTLASFRGDRDVSDKLKGFGKGITRLVLGFFGGAGSAVSNRIFPPKKAESTEMRKLNRSLRKLK